MSRTLTCARTVTLAEVANVNPSLASILNGRTPKTASFLPMAAVSEDGRYSLIDKPFDEVRTGYTPFTAGDVLVAKITPCMENGKAAHVRNLETAVGFASTEFHVVRPGPELDGRYAFHMIWNEQFRSLAAENMTGSAGQKRVPAEFVRRYKFPLPELKEQRRIGAILDKADEIATQREQILDTFHTFITAAFVHFFGDPIRNTRKWATPQVAELLAQKRPGTKCGPFGSALKRNEYTNSGIPVWGIDNVQPNRFVEHGSLFITPAKYRELEAYEVRNGDVLISRAGTVGRMCVAAPSGRPSIIGTNLIRVVLDSRQVAPEYFVALFTYFAGRFTNLRANGKQDSYSFMNTGSLSQIRIPLPPLDLQAAFVRFLDKAEALEARRRRAQEISVDLKKSLISRALVGALQ